MKNLLKIVLSVIILAAVSNHCLAQSDSITPTSIYVSNITGIEYDRMSSANNRRTSVTNSGIYMQQSGNDNDITINQVNTYQLIAGNGSQTAPVQGNNNKIVINQGDVISKFGQSLVELSVYGDMNSVTANQSTNINGNSTGVDLGGHYQSVQISGSLNTVSTSQIGQNNYAEVNITGNNNNQLLLQNGSGLQSFTSISGNNNILNTTQIGTGQHFLDVTLTGDSNSVTATQSGSIKNSATINLTNAGGPASVNLIQTGGQTYSVSQTCITPSGCGTVVIRQGN
jgi:hypothetical protein